MNIKKEWFPVHVPDSGRVTDYVIMEGDPVNGTFIGCYGDMSAASYHARLHNNFVSPIGLLNEIDAMFQSEIDFRITAWAGGIEWDCGHQLQGNEPTIEEALVAVVNAAKKLYPKSHFALTRPYEVPLSEDLYEMEFEDLS
jgi:hypothetical protein